jgi:hypothetical protein
MANLIWQRKTGPAKNLLADPFKSEEELERTVFGTKELLDEIFLLKRQVRGGSKPGIPDIIGVDSDNNVCIVEIKNTPVTAAILPQVLQYALWAESNPDSIKNLWLEAKDRPEDLDFAFDSYEIRVIIIAPSIDPATLQVVGKINYEVDLVEVKRWADGPNHFLLVNRLERPTTPKVKTVKGLAVYDRAFYEAHFNKESVKHFLDYADQVDALVQRKDWPLDRKFNKYYCAFKQGFFIAFGIKWLGSRSFGLFFKVPVARARRLAPKGVPMTRYEEQWKEAVFKVDPGITKVTTFAPLLAEAVKTLSSPK